MIEFGGVIYYIDIEALSKAISPTGNKPNDKIVDIKTKTFINSSGEIVNQTKSEFITERGKEIDATKYEIIRLMIETLIDYSEEIDDSLGYERALQKTPLSYKLAFNTLYENGILKEKE
jgi:hypothetical protein